MSGQEEAPLPPHVLIFPLPVQGHVNSMFRLAELICLAGVDITFLISDFGHSRLHRHANIQALFGRYPGFRFRTIPDGLPDDHPRAGERLMEIFPSMKNVTEPLFKEMMVSTGCLKSDDRRPVTCVIADGILSFAGDVALEKGIPLVYFRTISASCFWVYFCIQEIIEAGEMTLKGWSTPSSVYLRKMVEHVRQGVGRVFGVPSPMAKSVYGRYIAKQNVEEDIKEAAARVLQSTNISPYYLLLIYFPWRGWTRGP